MSWAQLEAMMKENRDTQREETAAAPTVCPIDGTILHVNPAGVRNCPMGNFRWP